jgi:hypothetical protein
VRRCRAETKADGDEEGQRDKVRYCRTIGSSQNLETVARTKADAVGVTRLAMR